MRGIFRNTVIIIIVSILSLLQNFNYAQSFEIFPSEILVQPFTANTLKPKFGFAINYKWIQGYVFEGSPQFTGSVPTYDMVDAQMNYLIEKSHLTIKLGASNVLGIVPLFDSRSDSKRRTVFNNLNYQVYGGPYVGRLAYISLLFDIDHIHK